MRLNKLICIGALMVGTIMTGTQAMAAGGTKIAVCDLSTIFNNYKEAKKLNEEFKERTKKIKAETASRQTAIQQIQQTLSGLGKESKEYEKVIKQAQTKVIELQVYQKIQQQSLLRDHMRLTKKLFTNITAAVEKVAQAKGIDMVVQLESREIAAQTSQELMAQLINRKVLYNSKTINITKDVLNVLNES